MRLRTLRSLALLFLAGIVAPRGAYFAQLETLTTSAPAELRALETFDAAWTIIDEQHFDPHFNGVDWAAVREELRPKAERASDREALRAVIRDMLARLKQSHFALVPAEALGTGAQGSKESPAGTCGLDLRWIEDELVVVSVELGGPAARAGVASGWVLRALDGKTSAALAAEVPGGSLLRPDASVRKVAMHALDGPVGTTVALGLADLEEKEHALTLARVARDARPFDMPGLPTFFLTAHHEVVERAGLSIGVVRFSNWFTPLLAPLDEALVGLRGCDALVLDLRGNTGGDAMVMNALAGHFFDETVSLGTQRMRHGSMEFRVQPRTRFGGEDVEPYLGPLVILTDGITGSCSEVFTGGMRALERVTVIGERTAGAALPATLSPLPNGDSLIHAIGEVTNAHGDKLEGDGVRPDVEVHPTRADWAAGRDVALEAALRWLERDAGR